MSLLTLIAATVMMDDIKRIEREKEQKRIQDAKDIELMIDLEER